MLTRIEDDNLVEAFHIASTSKLHTLSDSGRRVRGSVKEKPANDWWDNSFKNNNLYQIEMLQYFGVQN